MSLNKDKKGYPTDMAGCVMKDRTGAELFVPSEHSPQTIADRLKLGWTLVEDRRPAPAAEAWAKEEAKAVASATKEGLIATAAPPAEEAPAPAHTPEKAKSHHK